MITAINLGGLGVRRVTSLAIPAYLASAASTLTLQDHMTGPIKFRYCALV